MITDLKVAASQAQVDDSLPAGGERHAADGAVIGTTTVPQITEQKPGDSMSSDKTLVEHQLPTVDR